MGRFPVEICHLSCIRTHQSKKVLDFLPVFQLSAQQQILDRFFYSPKIIRFNIKYLKVSTSKAHTPDLQSVIFCVKPANLFSFLKKVDLHVTQSSLQLHNLPLTLS